MRSKIYLFTLLGLILGISVLVTGAKFVPRVHSPSIMEYREITVKPGDTLWAIAKNALPNKDPREIVYIIRKENQLQQAMVYPGQTLRVPASHQW